MSPAAGAVELGELVAGAIRSVIQAQDELDDHARRRAEEYLAAPPGALALPPLHYAFTSVAVEIELSTTVTRTETAVAGGSGSRLLCRPLDPTSVSLYGYQASSGTRVSVVLAPVGPLPPRPEATSP